ncbi:hypothetical protein ACLF3G_28815 [Falsiroseomonas sp. HC035]|uniref:hypothetical protein n=1 Tax=Falsiroseomonas sp. HC035 TaxID=3390999 RepID=UPI003D3204E7
MMEIMPIRRRKAETSARIRLGRVIYWTIAVGAAAYAVLAVLIMIGNDALSGLLVLTYSGFAFLGGRAARYVISNE